MVGQLILENMEKRLAIALVVAVVLMVMFAALWRNAVNAVNTQPAGTAEYDTAMTVLEEQRNRHAERARRYEAIADSLLSELARVKGKSNQTKIKYVQDINAWRALPDNARDERINFFAKELATVDTIAEW